MAKKGKSLKCAICGNFNATTAEHLPPKSIYPKPRPNNLITVPACMKCNHNASKDDEEFAVYLSMHIGIDSPEAKNLWKQHILKTLRHNKRLHREILSKIQSVPFYNPGGIYLGEGAKILWPSDVHDKTVERIIRGLYYYHYGEILGDKIKCNVQWLKKLDIDTHDITKTWSQHEVGNELFIYRYGRAEESPLNSIWVFQFYKSHWASGYTYPVDDSEQSIHDVDYAGG